MIEKSVNNFLQTGDPEHLVDVLRICLHQFNKLRWSEVFHNLIEILIGVLIAFFIFWVFILPIMAGWYAHKVESKGYMESWREAQIAVLGGEKHEEVN